MPINCHVNACVARQGVAKKMVSTQSARQDDHAGGADQGVGDKKWGNERMMVEC